MNAPPNSKLAQPAQALQTHEMPLLELSAVSYRIDGHDILSNINLTLQRGELVSIIGPNGGGKSTLLKLIAGNLKPSQGHISTPNTFTIGLVPQRFNIPKSMPLRVSDYLALKPNTGKPIPSSMVRQLGIDELLDKSMHQLSGGEMQRVLLTASLTPVPDLLLLDEPMQGIDPQSETLLYELLRHIPKQLGCAVLIISHDLHWVMKGTEHVLCINQHICCEGTPQNIVQHDSYKNLFANQHAFYAHHHHCEHEHDCDQHTTQAEAAS